MQTTTTEILFQKSVCQMGTKTGWDRIKTESCE